MVLNAFFLITDAELQEKYEQQVSGHKTLIDEMKNIENANEQFQVELQKTEERAKNAENLLQDVSFVFSIRDLCITFVFFSENSSNC